MYFCSIIHFNFFRFRSLLLVPTDVEIVWELFFALTSMPSSRRFPAVECEAELQTWPISFERRKYRVWLSSTATQLNFMCYERALNHLVGAWFVSESLAIDAGSWNFLYQSLPDSANAVRRIWQHSLTFLTTYGACESSPGNYINCAQASCRQVMRLPLTPSPFVCFSSSFSCWLYLNNELVHFENKCYTQRVAGFREKRNGGR